MEIEVQEIAGFLLQMNWIMSKMEDKTKQKLKKLFGFGDWKKEIFWILFWAAIFFFIYSYQQDMKLCKEIVANPCDYCIAEGMNKGTVDTITGVLTQDLPGFNNIINITNITVEEEITNINAT